MIADIDAEADAVKLLPRVLWGLDFRKSVALKMVPWSKNRRIDFPLINITSNCKSIEAHNRPRSSMRRTCMVQEYYVNSFHKRLGP